MKKKILLWGIFCAFRFLGYTQEPLQCQDAVIALDENGEATITSSDVLVNTSGRIIAPDVEAFFTGEYSYDLPTNTINFIENTDELCNTFNFFTFSSFDKNPISDIAYIYGGVIDLPFDNFTLVDLENRICSGIGLSSFSTSDFDFILPSIFTFDKDGILYGSGFSGLFVFEISSNLRTPFADIFIDPFETGITYDFDNHRILVSISNSSSQELIAIDIDTQETTTLFSFDPPDDCNAKALEYVGNNIVLASGGNVFNDDNNCGVIYSIDIVTQEIEVLFESDYPEGFGDFLFVEDQVENATLSTTVFTCDDIGENTVEVTQLVDGNLVSCEVTVTIQATFEFTNCPVYRQLSIDSNTGMGIIPDLTQNLDLTSSCSSDFEITQDIPEGTLVESGENIVVTLTAIDELGQTALCFTTVSTGSVLSVDTPTLEENINLYPNPTTGTITLNYSSNIPLVEAIITDLNGRILKTMELNSPDTTQISLDDFSKGVYFIQVSSENASVVKRIVKN